MKFCEILFSNKMSFMHLEQTVVDEPYSPPPIKEEPEVQFSADQQQPSPARSSSSSSSGSYEIEEPADSQQQQTTTQQQKSTRFARRTSEVKAPEVDVSIIKWSIKLTQF